MRLLSFPLAKFRVKSSIGCRPGPQGHSPSADYALGGHRTAGELPVLQLSK